MPHCSRIPSLLAGLALGAATLLAAPDANATFFLASGNSGSLGDNVLVNSCINNATGPAALVQGCLNKFHSVLVDVSTAGGGSLTANGGQAKFDASGGNINNFTINFADPTLGFSGIVFNINTQNKTTSTGTFVVDAVDALGNPEAPQTFTDTLAGNGNNFFNLISTDGEVASSVTVTSSLANIIDIRQVRIAAQSIPTTPVPEPASMALLGAGLMGVGMVRLRKRA